MKWLAHASMWLMAAGLTAQEPEPGSDQAEAEESKQSSQQQQEESAKPFKQEFAPIIPM